MKKYSDYIFEQQLDEWINAPDDMVSEGFIEWLKKMKKKLGEWLSGKKYDKNTIWTPTKKNKRISLDTGDGLEKIFDKNGDFQKKFSKSYKLLKDSDVAKCGVLTSLNSDKALTMVTIWTDNIDLAKNVLNKTKHKDITDDFIKEIKKLKSFAFVINTEFADNKDDDTYKKLAIQHMYQQFIKHDKIWFYYEKDATNYNILKYLGCEPPEDKALYSIDIDTLKKKVKL